MKLENNLEYINDLLIITKLNIKKYKIHSSIKASYIYKILSL